MTRPMTNDRHDDRLETIADMLELARRIVEALETGEMTETLEDADAAIEEARELALKLAKGDL